MIIKIIKIALLLMLTIFILIASFLYVEGSTPLDIPRYTLSNGKQEIIFQGMIHIADTKFYEQVKKDVSDKKKNGYVYLYELVQAQTEEGNSDLSNVIGIPKGFYNLASEVLNVDSQSMHLEHITKDDINADISAEDLVVLIKSHPLYKKEKVIAISEEEIEEINDLSDVSDFSKSIIKGFARIIFRTMADNPEIMFDDNKLFHDVILSKRDEKLFIETNKIKEKNIIINYGLAHFKGFFEKLKKNDSNWKIIETKYITAF
jgi:hypothetical protein